MPIDAYSLCPGGTGKKVKFCCPDFVNELNKLDRLLEAEQHVACLQHVERLLQDGRPRACLLAVKGLLLRMTEQVEAAEANAATFLQHFPDNPMALAESAVLAALNDQPESAMRQLQRALAASGEIVEHRVYRAIGIVAETMLEQGHWHSGRALLHTQMLMADKDPTPARKLLDVNRARQLPLILKDDPPLRDAKGSPWADRLASAMQPLDASRWQESADRLTKLAEELPETPQVWNNLAVVRSWLADRPGMIEALRKFASLFAASASSAAAVPGAVSTGDSPLEDAVEAEALAMLLSPDPLGDQVDVLKLTWTVRDAERCTRPC